jgi:hypothetical protein
VSEEEAQTIRFRLPDPIPKTAPCRSNRLLVPITTILTCVNKKCSKKSFERDFDPEDGIDELPGDVKLLITTAVNVLMMVSQALLEPHQSFDPLAPPAAIL